MTLFKKIIDKKVLPALSVEQAMIIYEGLKTKDANTLFLEDNIPTEYSLQVIDEIKRLESEMINKMSGNFLLSAEEVDDKGVVIKEAVYFVVTTESALKNSMSSNLLDVNKVVTDVRIWSDGKPDESPSWYIYKNSFNEE